MDHHGIVAAVCEELKILLVLLRHRNSNMDNW